MKKRPLLFPCVIFLLLLPLSYARAQSVTVAISDDTLRAGDLTTLSVTLVKNNRYDEIIFPDSTYFNQSFELRVRKRYRVSEFKDSLSYRLQFWEVSDATIPALPVKLIAGTDTTVVFTEPVSIAFQSVLKSNQPELRPLKPIFAFARAWWIYFLILLLLVAAAVAGWYYYKRQKEQPEPKPPKEFEPQPFSNPLRELENNLQQLRSIPKHNDMDFKQFYIYLGDAIRTYFEQMYHMPALESTSGEILRELNKRAVDDIIIKDTRAVLNEADMVKFAKFKPTIEQADKALNKAEDFLSTVKKRHANRVQMMRRQHLEKVEQERQTFNETQKQEKTA